MRVDFVERGWDDVDILDRSTPLGSAPQEFDLAFRGGVYLDHMAVHLTPSFGTAEPVPDAFGLTRDSKSNPRRKPGDVSKLVNRAICHNGATAHDQDAVSPLPQLGERMRG